VRWRSRDADRPAEAFLLTKKSIGGVSPQSDHLIEFSFGRASFTLPASVEHLAASSD
jgi:hypothetical protein